MKSNKARQEWLNSVALNLHDLIFLETAEERAAELDKFLVSVSARRNDNRDFCALIFAGFMLSYAAQNYKDNLMAGMQIFCKSLPVGLKKAAQTQRAKKKLLDLSAQPENLDITAEQFSALVNKPNLPKEFQTILDTYCEVKQ